MKFATVFIAALFLFAAIASAQMAVTSGGDNVTYEMKSFLTSKKVLFQGAQNTPHYRDYIGLFRAGSETRLEWCYLDGTKVVDPKRLMSTGGCTFNVAPGNYAARVYSAGLTGAPMASVLFTAEQPTVEYRTVSEEGAVTITRVNQGPLDKAVISRAADTRTLTLLIQPATALTQKKVSYTGETVTSVVKAAPAAPQVKSKAVNP